MTLSNADDVVQSIEHFQHHYARGLEEKWINVADTQADDKQKMEQISGYRQNAFAIYVRPQILFIARSMAYKQASPNELQILMNIIIIHYKITVIISVIITNVNFLSHAQILPR